MQAGYRRREYAANIWDPHLVKDVNLLEKVQRKAARFVKHDYARDSSVTAMLQDLGWRNLSDRRRDLRLALLFKITHGHVRVPAESLNLKHPYRQTRANHNYKYQILGAKTTELQKFVIHRTIEDWNSLPASIAEAESLVSFKSQLAKSEGTRA